MPQIEEYKCPNCGGTIEFDANSQNLKCRHCSAEIDVHAFKEYQNDKNKSNDNLNWNTGAGKQWEESEKQSLRTYTCVSCGGQIIGDETMGSTSCPYCGNFVVIPSQFSGNLKPDYVIPFKLDKEAAKEGLRKHLQGKKLLPSVFKDENHIDELIGVYVPYWLFDADVYANIHYKASNVRVWTDSRFRYTETRYFDVIRAGNISFDKVPVDGSIKMDDELMESIEPFYFEDAVDFETAFLAGYVANKYDVDSKESINRATQRLKESAQDSFRQTVHGYSIAIPQFSNIELQNSVVKYALYPVWILNTTWNGNKYVFAMNGQTGKFVGDLPSDDVAAMKIFLSTLFTTSISILAVVLIWWMFL